MTWYLFTLLKKRKEKGGSTSLYIQNDQNYLCKLLLKKFKLDTKTPHSIRFILERKGKGNRGKRKPPRKSNHNIT